jgi:hypothetical protein
MSFMIDNELFESISDADMEAVLAELDRPEELGAPQIPNKLHYDSLEELQADAEAYSKAYRAWKAFMKKAQFLSMAQIGKFSELIAGQTVPTYEGGKVVGTALIPKELEPILSDSYNSGAMLWHIDSIGTVSHQNRGGGQFQFTVSSRQGFQFTCRFDPLDKQISKIKIQYDDMTFTYPDVSVTEFVQLLSYSALVMFKDLLDNAKMNLALTDRVKEYIKRIESRG